MTRAVGLWSIFCVALWVGARAALSEDLILYTEIEDVDTASSLRRVRELPIVYYKFLYDSVGDRIQLGVVGPSAQRLFPESIDVLPSTVFGKSASATPSQGPTTVTNLPVVDKNVLFMHGVAAIKELTLVYEQLNASVHSLGEIDKDTELKYQALRANLHRDLSQLQAEKLRVAEEELEVARLRLEEEKRRVEREEERVRAQLESERGLLEFEEQLSKQRLLQQEALAKDALAKQLALERELAERKDALTRGSAEAMQDLKARQSRDLEARRLELEKERIKAEIDAKAQYERLNEEAALRRLEMQAKLDTERMVLGIKSVSAQLATLARDLLSRPKQITIVALIFLAVLACYYALRELSVMVREYIQSHIGKPSLVRETSYHIPLWPDVLTFAYHFEGRRLAESMRRLEDQFRDIVLGAEDKERVVNLAYATRNTRRSGAPFRHVLLHGPPGTGKTLIARRLAQCSGMDYAILSGGDVAPLGEDAVNQLHALFKWANRSAKGLLVFIDEAEAFLSSRAGSMGEGASDSHLRNALNALLYQTGTPSKHFMMVLATNRPEDLDAAILDRIDVSLLVGLPAEPQRAELVKQYMDAHVSMVAQRSQRRGLARLLLGSGGSEVDGDCYEPEAVRFLARATEGFSGREISKLFISAQYTMYLAPDRRLTWPALKKVAQDKVAEHVIKATGFHVVDIPASEAAKESGELAPAKDKGGKRATRKDRQ